MFVSLSLLYSFPDGNRMLATEMWNNSSHFASVCKIADVMSTARKNTTKSILGAHV